MRPRDSRATTLGDSQTLGGYTRPRPCPGVPATAHEFSGFAGLEQYRWTSA